MSSRSLDDLSPRIRPQADTLISTWIRLHPANKLIVTYTLRTQAEQDAAVASHRSRTHHSMHLAQPPDGKACAIDVCPGSLIIQPNYAPSDPLWWELGDLGKSLGLIWGGQWFRPSPPPVGHPPTDPEAMWDPGHFQVSAAIAWPRPQS